MSDSDYGIKLAARLAQLRLQRGWSLDELAGASGISRASLSRIERSQVSPTADVLNQLCIVYGMTMSRLLAEIEEQVDDLFPLAQQPVWHDARNGYHRRMIIPPANTFRCELIECNLDPGTYLEYSSPPVQGLEQYIWLTAGELSLGMNAESWTLTKGDSLRFHLSGKTTFRAHEIQGAQYLMVVCKS